MNFDLMMEPLHILVRQLSDFLPRLGLAFLVVIAGWLFAKAVRFTVVRSLRAVNFNVLAERAGLDGFLKRGGVESDTIGIFGILVYWLALVASLVIAFNGLGLTYITDLLSQLVQFLPKVIAALLILAFGTYFARFINNAIVAYCRQIGVQDAEPLGRIAQYALIVFVVLIALDQMRVGGEIVRQSFLILLAGIVFALALAFGIGGKEWAASVLERWWPKSKSDRE